MNRSSARLAAVCILVFAASISVSAAPGDLDPTFGTGGIVITNLPGNLADEAHAIAIDGSGRIVLAGFSGVFTTSNFAVARYASTGALDTSFDTDGIVVTDFPSGLGDSANGIVIDSSGKIIVVGAANGSFGVGDFGIARYNTNGSLDTTFDTDGLVVTDFDAVKIDIAYAVAIDSNGKIVVAGVSGTNIAVARYNTNGSLDTTFSGDGMVTGPVGVARAIAIDGSDSIVVAGYTSTSNTSDFIVARYDSSGTPDATFGGSGSVTTDFGTKDQAYAVTIDGSGRIVVGGSSGITSASNYALARYTTSGALDTSFDTDGLVTTDINGLDIVYGLAIDSNGDIIAAGLSGSNFSLARYLTTGAIDTSFGSSGSVVTDVAGGGLQDNGYAMTLDGLGNIVVAGRAYNGSNFDFAAARYSNVLVLPGELQFSSATYSVAEDAGTVTITVSRVNGSSGAVCVDYATSNGSAIASLDYTATSNTLCWTDGDSADKTFTVPIIADGMAEPDETFNVTLSNSTGGAVLGTPSATVVTILASNANLIPALSPKMMALMAGLLALAAAVVLSRRLY